MFAKYFLLSLFSLSGIFCNAASIKGQIELTDDWAPVIYLSSINTFDDLQTATYQFLRYQSTIDSRGYFEFSDIDLEPGDQVYRLHICKKGDPVSTIIIGGKEENYIHFIMNNQSDILVVNSSSTPGIAACTIEGHPTGGNLKNLFNLQKQLNTPLDLPSEQNRSFVKQQVFDGLRSQVDTASNPIVRLLAFHLISESFASANHLDLMRKLDTHLVESNHASSYYQSFRTKLSYLEYQAEQKKATSTSWPKWLGLIFGVLILGVLGRVIFKNSLNKKGKNQLQVIQSLSTQEKRVFNLLKKGKTNKEISSELHIEVSTVKSHLHKIYSRLGVKSRKEIVNKDI